MQTIEQKYQLATSGDLDRILSTNNSDIYRYCEGGQNRILKIYKTGSRQISEIGGKTVAEKAAQLNVVSQLVQKYLYEAVNKEFYSINGHVCEVSPEIAGDTADLLRAGSEEHIELLQKIAGWKEKWQELTKDRKFRALPNQTQRHFRKTDFVHSNIIFTPNSYFKIIDW